MSNITLATIERRCAEVAEMRRRLRICNSINISKRGRDLEFQYELWEIGQVSYWFCWFVFLVSCSMISYSHTDELIRWGTDLRSIQDCNTTSIRGMYTDSLDCVPQNVYKKLIILQTSAKLLGAIIFGIMSDIFGRLFTLRILVTFHGLSSVALIISTTPRNGYFYRFLIAFTGTGIIITCFALLIDYCSRQTRCVSGLLFHTFRGFGVIILGIIMINSQTWWYREILWLSVTETLLICAAWSLPESARLYYSYGKEIRAWNTLRQINLLGPRTDLGVEVHQSFYDNILKSIKSSQETFKSKFILRLIMLSVPGFLVNDLLLKINDDRVLAQICDEKAYLTICLGILEVIMYSMSIPFYVTLGRKFTIVTLHIAASLIYMYIYYIPHMNLLHVMLTILGSLIVQCARAGILIMAAETFPTNCRATTLGVIICFHEFGVFIYHLFNFNICTSNGMQIYCIDSNVTFLMNIVAACVLLFVPPTRHRILVDTFSEEQALAERNIEYSGLKNVPRCF